MSVPTLTKPPAVPLTTAAGNYNDNMDAFMLWLATWAGVDIQTFIAYLEDGLFGDLLAQMNAGTWNEATAPHALAQAGYQQFPKGSSANGLILQWGLATVDSAHTNGTVNALPLTFKSANFGGVGNFRAYGNPPRNVAIEVESLASIRVHCTLSTTGARQSTTGGIFYIAAGV